MNVCFIDSRLTSKKSIKKKLDSAIGGETFIIFNIPNDSLETIINLTPSNLKYKRLAKDVNTIQKDEVWLITEDKKYSFNGHSIVLESQLVELSFGNIVQRSLNEIYVFDVDHFKFKYVNQCALANLQYSMKEMEQMTPLDIKPEYNLKSFKRLLKPLSKGESGKIQFETIHLRKDGSTYPVEVHLSLAEEGNSKFYSAIILDVTEKKETLIKALEIQSQFELLAQNYPNGSVSLIDKDLKILFTEGEGYAEHGIDPSTFIGKDSKDVLLPAVYNSLKKAIKSIKNNETIHYEVPFYDKVYRNTCKAIKSENGVLNYYILRVIDITELKDLYEKTKVERNNYLSVTNALNKSALVSIADKKGIIIHANEEFCKASGFNKKELIGKSHSIINSGYHPKEFWAGMWKTVAKGKTWRADVKNKAKDGSFYWVDTVINPIFDIDGKIEQYLSIRYLITERKELELAKNELTQRLTLANKAAKLGVWTWNLTTHKIEWDDYQSELYGLKSFDGNFESWKSMVFLEDLEFIEKKIRNIVENKITELDYSFRIIKPSGQVAHIQAKGHRVVINGEDIVIGVNYDITDDVLQKKEILSLKEKYELALKASNDGFWDWDLIENTIEYSDRYFQILGLPPNTSTDTEYWKNLIHPEDRDRITNAVNDAIESDRDVFELESRRLHTKGHYIYVLVRAYITRASNGKAVRVTGTLMDTTYLKNVQNEVVYLKDRYASLLNSLDGVVWETDFTNQTNNFVSSQCLKIFGYDPKEWLADSNFWIDRIHPADKKRLLNFHKTMIFKRVNHEIEYRFRIKSGEYLWIKDKITVEYKDNKPYRLVGIMMDITRTKQAEINLENTLRQLNLGIETAEMGVWELDLKNNRMDWNDQMFKIFELNPSAFRHTIEDFRSKVFPEDLVTADKEMAKIANGKTVRDVKFRIKTKSGTKHIYASGAPVLNEKGDVIKFMGINMDVSQVAKYQERLEKTIRQLNLAIETSNMGIWEWTLDTDELYWNEQTYNIFEIPTTELSDKINIFWEILYPEDRQLMENAMTKARQGEKVTYQYRIKTKSGKVKHIRSSAARTLEKDGTVKSLFGINLDLTSLIENQNKLELALDEKDTLFKELHHRIKNNLQMVISLLFLKENMNENEYLKSFIKETSTKIQSISAIHEQLLQMKGVNKLDIKDYLKTLVHNLVHTYSDSESDYELDLKMDSSLINIDIVLSVGLIVNEIISNAIKYAYPETKKGRIKVYLKKQKDKMNLTVADDGIGISTSKLGALEDSYGLQLISLFTKQIKGELNLSNKNGTTFNIKFPINA
ncbi:PAS domain-containing protein [Fulvivirga lutea]|uniref:histidine kinase n=1 Tax=Fulvivirga lutea TaxID=2810512 RepID=A0A975A1J4_9BACT|nr:PAS domain-containing protein [Fulvivirga lutea]QSE97587.1 PAS domain-containing protein [Fulvivirga lutea]